MGHQEHRRQAPLRVPTAVLTISDTRTQRTDASGGLLRRLLERSGHPVVHYQILPDEPVLVRRALRLRCADPRVSAVILTGGTGVSPRDRTCEVVHSLMTQRLEGFGEIFRMLSFRQIGAAAFLSRAVAGVYRGKAIFSLPGSQDAVRLAMLKLILPEIGHLVSEIRKPGTPRRRRSRVS
jgi:molybdopterin adenylyltransferase